MMVTASSAKPGPGDPGWIPCSLTPVMDANWVFANHDQGGKTMYLWQMDIAFNISSTPGTSSIIYDTVPPVVSASTLVLFDNDNVTSSGTNSRDVHAGLDTCADVLEIAITTDGLAGRKPAENSDLWT